MEYPPNLEKRRFEVRVISYYLRQSLEREGRERRGGEEDGETKRSGRLPHPLPTCMRRRRRKGRRGRGEGEIHVSRPSLVAHVKKGWQRPNRLGGLLQFLSSSLSPPPPRVFSTSRLPSLSTSRIRDQTRSANEILTQLPEIPTTPATSPSVADLRHEIHVNHWIRKEKDKQRKEKVKKEKGKRAGRRMPPSPFPPLGVLEIKLEFRQ